VHQVGNLYIVNSWCTVRKTSRTPTCLADLNMQTEVCKKNTVE